MIVTILIILLLCTMVHGAYMSWHCTCLMYAHLIVARGMITKDVMRAAEAQGLDFNQKAERVKEVLDELQPLPKPPFAYQWWVERIAVRYDA